MRSVGDGGVRRPGAARHHLSRALRRDHPSRSADFGARFAGGRDPASDRDRARSRRAGRGRTCWSNCAARLDFPAFTQDRRHAASIATTGLHRPLRTRAGHRLSRGLPRRGRQTLAGRRAESAPMGSVHRRTRRSLPFTCPMRIKWHRYANLGYLEFAKKVGLHRRLEPIVLQLCREPLQKFRLAGQGLYDGPRPAQPADRERLATLLRSAAVLVRAARDAGRPTATCIRCMRLTQRPMMMYHSWDSQNAWLRQIIADNAMYVNVATAAALGLRRRRLGVARIAARPTALPHSHDGRRRAHHGVDVECDRQAGRRVGARPRCAGGDDRDFCSIT